ncbi:hypothetical protein BST33_11615 [Mycolicibacter minnesotensis]|uniref:Uncharacterized protein n=1 Tax=Mycolicibacter minnesotensis TaxID=1118379 RepID=A0A7I7R504_9MYCO|nr:hypothetical protein [Mycolicibacter minnesotensis]ORB00311.1 hypothetical protein BST33_11615 [Mycolicibacter minnesotensis]BBY33671.1 hypothetical protein MMIN_17320 [Mycolicibacter minnesotensis]
MLIMGVLCLVAAVVSLVFGVRTLVRPLTGDPEQLVLRVVAPAQVAVGVILGAGGALVLAGPSSMALLALIISITGALATLAAGAWQGARYAARLSADAAAASGGGCCGSGGCCGEPAPVEEAGCGSGCGCADSAPAEPATGCGSGCGCG